MNAVLEELSINRYPIYKYSEFEWLGEIPKDWKILKAKYLWQEIIELSDTGSETLLSVSQYIGVNNREQETRSENLKGYKKVTENDLVINIMLAWLGGLGLSSLNGVVSPAYAVYRLVINANPKYLHYLYRTESYLNEFARRSKGVVPSRWRMYTDDFGQVPTIIPLLPEQTDIVDFLDGKTAQIDQAIAQKEKLIELLKERRQILIQNAVTRGLNPNVPMKDSGVAWIGEIPAHWTLVPIRRLVDVRDGTHETPLYVGDETDCVPLVTSKDFDGDIIQFENIKKISRKDHLNISKRSGVEKGDVLMSMIGGNIGKSLIVGDFNTFSIKNVALFKTMGDAYLGKYIIYYIESGLLQKQIDIKSRGGAQGFLSLSDIRNLVFFKMEKEERNQIVNYLNIHVSIKFSNVISLKQKEIIKLKEYKSTLINSAVTGKIKVS